ncbi:MAG: hypothetical protein ACREX9_06765 [Gammaproteobacteria bacterium]
MLSNSDNEDNKGEHNRRDGNTEVAKKTHNPVSDLISVPLQNNFNFRWRATM